MNENLSDNKPSLLSNPDSSKKSGHEKLSLSIKIASKKDLKDYRDIRLLASSSDDASMLGFSKDNYAWEENREEDEWQEDLSRHDMFAVLARSDSEVVGMGHAVQESAQVWKVTYDYVQESFRRMGIQKKMLAERLKEIKKRGGLKVRGVVLTQNIGSISTLKFFGFTGFEEVSTKPMRVGKELKPAYEVELDLTSPEVIKKIDEILE